MSLYEDKPKSVLKRLEATRARLGMTDPCEKVPGSDEIPGISRTLGNSLMDTKKHLEEFRLCLKRQTLDEAIKFVETAGPEYEVELWRVLDEADVRLEMIDESFDSCRKKLNQVSEEIWETSWEALLDFDPRK